MAKFGEWQKHFEKVTKNKQMKLKRALKVLESDPMIKKEFKWTGIFSLKNFMVK